MYSLIINKKSYFQNFFSMGSLKKKQKNVNQKNTKKKMKMPTVPLPTCNYCSLLGLFYPSLPLQQPHPLSFLLPSSLSLSVSLFEHIYASKWYYKVILLPSGALFSVFIGLSSSSDP